MQIYGNRYITTYRGVPQNQTHKQERECIKTGKKTLENRTQFQNRNQ